MGLNQAEDFTFNLCRRSFLSLWSYANPQRNAGKELCDILVVCYPHVIIISVKEIAVGDPSAVSTDWERWRRRAVDASVKQIYGAERALKSQSQVTRSDGSQGLPLPAASQLKIHRVAVALGAKGKAPIASGDFGKGFVHVFDEVSLQIVMRELDTIGDFVAYLDAKENLPCRIISNGASEEDLLALYLHRGRQFPTNYNTIIIDSGLWEKLVAKQEWLARKEADHDSYIWDKIIEEVGQAVIHDNLEYSPGSSEAELALRTMAREDRFARRILGQAFNEFMRLSAEGKVESRMLGAPSGTVYVFLASPHGSERKLRIQQLRMRCFVARGQFPNAQIVIGIASEVYEPGKGHSLDICYLRKDAWTPDDQKIVEGIQRDLGYFASPTISSGHIDEFPGACPEQESPSARGTSQGTEAAPLPPRKGENAPSDQT